jgi:Type I phosphodiesterase / nucleotide pyrophosphatase
MRLHSKLPTAMKPLLTLATAAFIMGPSTAPAKIQYVLHITCDGLRADALKTAMDSPANAAAYPGFRRLLAEGAGTFNARCDFDYSETIPNHTGVVTGRPVLEPGGLTSVPFTADAATDLITAPAHGLRDGDNVLLATTGTLPGGLTAGTIVYRLTEVLPDTFKLTTYTTASGRFAPVDITSAGTGVNTLARRASHGFSANFPGASDSVHKLSTAPLAYKYSTFDMAHDRGLSTAIIGGKTRLNLYRDSYGATLGAADTAGNDYGRNKIDFLSVVDANNAVSLSNVRTAAVNQIAGGTLRRYTLLHFTDCDTGTAGGGHTVSWNSPAWIENGTKVLDSYIVSLLDAITASSVYNGKTAVILTADHGGGQAAGTGNSHTDASAIFNINIPLFLWGPGIPAGASAYSLFSNRTDPGTSNRPNAAPATPQPLRNTDTANIAMSLLGLPSVTGSYFIPEWQEGLNIRIEEGQTILSWPLYRTSHLLQCATGLNGTWRTLQTRPVETATHYQVTIPAGGPQCFWRLQPPKAKSQES